MSRKPHEPTDVTRKTVRAMAGYGTPHEGIAMVLDIDDKTLRKYYRRELDTAKIEANVKVAESLFKQATKEVDPSIAAAIFWMKVQAGWTEKNALDITSGGEQVSGVVIVKVPDNGRDSNED